MNFFILDYVWKILIWGVASSTVIYGITITTAMIFRSAGAFQVKRFLGYQYLLMMGTTIAGALFVVLKDPELAAGCFDEFVRHGSSINITRVISVAWLMTISVMVIREVRRYLSTRARLSRLPKLNNQRIFAVIDELKHIMDIKVEFDIYTSKCGASPFVFGVRTRRLVIPSVFCNEDLRDSLPSILAHELIHLRDLDSKWLLLELVCRRIFFYNPLSILAGKAFRHWIEKAADQEAVQSSGIEPAKFAKALLECLRLSNSERSHGYPNQLQSAASSGFNEMRNRLESLARPQKPSTSFRSHAWIFSWATITIFGFSLAQAGVLGQLSPTLGMTSQPILMCSQVQHERVIESWLQLKKSTSNQCEEQ